MNNIFWIGAIDGETSAALAIVLRPPGDDCLEDELRRFKSSGIDTLVSLLEPDEASWLGLIDEGALARKSGLQFLSYPIPDTQIPANSADFRSFVAALAERLQSGDRIGVHCRGSIGRATITAACTLIHLGWNAKDALRAIELARGCPVPDTPDQRTWILHYEAQP